MYESDYIKQMNRDANRLIEQEEQRKKLEKVYDQFGGNLSEIEKHYALKEEERQILTDIQAEQKHQEELDEIFLKTFKEN